MPPAYVILLNRVPAVGFRSSGRERHGMPGKLILSVLGLVFAFGVAFAEPIKVHPANPHYYLFNGQPTVLITSAEHYGEVVNLDFDYVTYLDALKAYGMNYTRFVRVSCFEMVASLLKVTRWAQTSRHDCPLGAQQRAWLRLRRK